MGKDENKHPDNKNMDKNRQTGQQGGQQAGQSKDQMKCKSCGMTFSSQDELRRHEQSQHSQEQHQKH